MRHPIWHDPGNVSVQQSESEKMTGASCKMANARSRPGSVSNLFESIKCDEMHMGVDVNVANVKMQCRDGSGDFMQVSAPTVSANSAMFQFSSQRLQGVRDNAAETILSKPDSPVRCTEPVRGNAAEKKPLIFSTEGRSLNSHEDPFGKANLGDGNVKSGSQRWADMVDVSLPGGAATLTTSLPGIGLDECMQGIRRYAPTIDDVRTSLGNAGIFHGGMDMDNHSELEAQEGIRDHVMADGTETPARNFGQAGPKPNLNGGRGMGSGNRGGSAWQRQTPIRFAETFHKHEVSSDGVTVDLDPNDMARNVARLDKALVCSVLGRRFPFFFLSSELHRRWSAYGEFQLIMTGEDCFVCLFASTEARDAVLLGGPWFIAGQVIGMDRWSVDMNLASPKGLSTPVWIRFPHLPLPCWDMRSIGRIAAIIGEPIGIDAQTDSWERCKYARVCVKLDLAQKLVSGVMVNGPSGKFYQKVEYEGLSVICFKCGLVGHKDVQCPAIRCAQQSPVQQQISVQAGTSLDAQGGCASSSGEARSGSGKEDDNLWAKSKIGLNSASGSVGVELRMQDQPPSTFEARVAREDDAGLGPWIMVQRRKKQSKRVGGNPLKKATGKAVVNVSSSRPNSDSSKQAGTSLISAKADDVETSSSLQKELDTPIVVDSNSTKIVEASSMDLVEENPSTAIVPVDSPKEMLMGIREWSTKIALGRELIRLGPPPNLPKKRRMNSIDLTDGGDASPLVDQ